MDLTEVHFEFHKVRKPIYDHFNIFLPTYPKNSLLISDKYVTYRTLKYQSLITNSAFLKFLSNFIWQLICPTY